MMRYVFAAPGPGGISFINSSVLVGDPEARTIAKDIVFHGNQVTAIGTTTDANFTVFPAGTNLPTPIATTLTGSRSAFLFSSTLDAFQPTTQFASFVWEDTIDDEGTGIAAWNEYVDHLWITGWRTTELQNGSVSSPRIAVASLFRQGNGFELVRDFTIDEASAASQDRSDTPGANLGLGDDAFNGSRAFLSAAGTAVGGGIAVDEQGLATVVGSIDYLVPTPTTTYTVSGPALQIRPTEALSVQNMDAVRTVVDLLPSGVARTDGTGDDVNWTRQSGTGRTTPSCALAQYGTAVVQPELERMFMDFRGEAVAGAEVAVIVDRPPLVPGGVASFGALQLGLPPQNPILLPTVFPGIELWTPSSPVFLPITTTQGESIVEPLWGSAGLPAGSWQIAIQYISLLPQSLCGDPDQLFAGSPGLIITW